LPGTLLTLGTLSDSLLMSRLTGNTFDQTVAVLVIPLGICSSCFVELERWKAIAPELANVPAALLIIGADSATAEGFRRDERLPFPVFGLADTQAQRIFGISITTSTRFLMIGRRLALVQSGPDDGPVGFIEGISAVNQHAYAK
jgi:hypothetical protein